MTGQISKYVKSFTLWELLKGLSLTGRYFMKRSITIQYPEEKTPQSHRFRGRRRSPPIVTPTLHFDSAVR